MLLPASVGGGGSTNKRWRPQQPSTHLLVLQQHNALKISLGRGSARRRRSSSQLLICPPVQHAQLLGWERRAGRPRFWAWQGSWQAWLRQAAPYCDARGHCQELSTATLDTRLQQQGRVLLHPPPRDMIHQLHSAWGMAGQQAALAVAVAHRAAGPGSRRPPPARHPTRPAGAPNGCAAGRAQRVSSQVLLAEGARAAPPRALLAPAWWGRGQAVAA